MRFVVTTLGIYGLDKSSSSIHSVVLCLTPSNCFLIWKDFGSESYSSDDGEVKDEVQTFVDDMAKSWSGISKKVFDKFFDWQHNIILEFWHCSDEMAILNELLHL